MGRWEPRAYLHCKVSGFPQLCLPNRGQPALLQTHERHATADRSRPSQILQITTNEAGAHTASTRSMGCRYRQIRTQAPRRLNPGRTYHSRRTSVPRGRTAHRNDDGTLPALLLNGQDDPALVPRGSAFLRSWKSRVLYPHASEDAAPPRRCLRSRLPRSRRFDF